MIGSKMIRSDDDNAKYIPTPEQIKAKCKQFQSKWSRATEQGRLRSDWRSPTPEIKTEIKTIRNVGRTTCQLFFKERTE